MALSTNSRIDWVNDGTLLEGSQDVDVVTVIIHELGHVLGLGHSADDSVVMTSGYTNPPERVLQPDDEEGVTYLYDSNITGSVTGTVSDSDGPIGGATVVLEGTIPVLSAMTNDTAPIGKYTIDNVPDPVTYTVTASADGFESATIDRKKVDGGTGGVDFTLIVIDGGNGDEGPPPCKGWRKNEPGCQD